MLTAALPEIKSWRFPELLSVSVGAVLTKAWMCLPVYSAVSDRDIETAPRSLQRKFSCCTYRVLGAGLPDFRSVKAKLLIIVEQEDSRRISFYHLVYFLRTWPSYK